MNRVVFDPKSRRSATAVSDRYERQIWIACGKTQMFFFAGFRRGRYSFRESVLMETGGGMTFSLQIQRFFVTSTSNCRSEIGQWRRCDPSAQCCSTAISCKRTRHFDQKWPFRARIWAICCDINRNLWPRTWFGRGWKPITRTATPRRQEPGSLVLSPMIGQRHRARSESLQTVSLTRSKKRASEGTDP